MLDALSEWLKLGGPTLLILLLLSLAAVTITVIKLWEFQELRLGRRDFVNKVVEAWQAGHADLAAAATGGSPSPLADVMRHAIKLLADPNLREAHARELIERHAADWLESLRRLLRPLEVISQLAPLLGLLGTVLGMIEAFRQLQAAGDRVSPSLLSGGLWEALLTTAAGLAVAIVALAAFHYLERQVERLQHDMESALTRLLTRPLIPAPATPSRSHYGNALVVELP